MAKIKEIHARQILDSRGNPTVEADVVLDDGSIGRASVPSGASTGKYEALELRDKDPKVYGGKSVMKAVNNVNDEIAKALKSMNPADQQKIDEVMIKLDGTENKSRLGANAILAVSLANAVATSQSKGLELYEYLNEFSKNNKLPYSLPHPMINIINGGRHAVNSADFQEYMIWPAQRNSFSERLRCGSEILHSLKKIIETEGYSSTVGDEGGFAPSIKSNTHQIEYILHAISDAGYKAGEDVFLALDTASSEFFQGDGYFLTTSQRYMTKSELIQYFVSLTDTYPVISIEDPLEENDFDGWAEMMTRLGDRVQIVGDDLYATNVNRIKKGIEHHSSNAVLIKPNQIGSLSETIDAINLAQDNGMKCIISHRSGETEDTFIADLAVAMRIRQIKTGSVYRSERLAKYNRLLRIEEKLGK